MAVTPMPEVPPCTSSVSPSLNCPRSNTMLHTVKYVSGKDAPSMALSPLGSGRHCAKGAAQYSAYPPPCTNAQTITPFLKPLSDKTPTTSTQTTTKPDKTDAPC